MKIFLEIIKMRKKSCLAIIALGLVNILLYIFIMSFQVSKLDALRNQWLDKRQRPSFGALDKTLIYSQGKKDLAVFNSRIPPKKDFMRVVGELFDIASNNGLSVGSVGYKPELIKDRNLLVYGLTFSVSGSYAAVKNFIADIEQSPEMVSLDQITLTGGEASQDSVKVSVQISAFFRTGKS
jgi:type IV pilus assembly protein PilO